MLNRLIPVAMKLRELHPPTYRRLVNVGRRVFRDRLGVYPREFGGERDAVAAVLSGGQWNMAYGRGLAHERLEADFGAFVGVPQAVAVGSGGVAIQMCLRALDIGHGDEVLLQVDTCAATAQAVMNANASPVFVDIDPSTFMADPACVERAIGPATKAIIATHMWGNPENMAALREIADRRGIRLIEDGCLALGAVAGGRPVGAWGDVAVFSFGCIKPVQGGEGGMIVTRDEALASELRSMRHWGDRTIDFGTRDVTTLCWNGRMSEIVAAVVREQLAGYPKHLSSLRASLDGFRAFLGGRPGLELVTGTATSVQDCVFTQAVLRLDESRAGIDKATLQARLTANGVQNWHANFELITSLSLFREGAWRRFLVKGDLERLARNYAEPFPVAAAVHARGGIGLLKNNFLSKDNESRVRSTLLAAAGGARP